MVYRKVLIFRGLAARRRLTSKSNIYIIVLCIDTENYMFISEKQTNVIYFSIMQSVFICL